MLVPNFGSKMITSKRGTRTECRRRHSVQIRGAFHRTDQTGMTNIFKARMMVPKDETNYTSILKPRPAKIISLVSLVRLVRPYKWESATGTSAKTVNK